MPGTTDWGMRSVQDDPDSDSWDENNVLHDYTRKSERAAQVKRRWWRGLVSVVFIIVTRAPPES